MNQIFATTAPIGASADMNSTEPVSLQSVSPWMATLITLGQHTS